MSASSASSASAANPTTPTTRILRPRHTPTPKMSDRKKALFSDTFAAANNNDQHQHQQQSSGRQLRTMPATIDEDDSDVGPIWPLHNSPSSLSSAAAGATNLPARILRRRATVATTSTSRRLEDQYEILGTTQDEAAAAAAMAPGSAEEKENAGRRRMASLNQRVATPLAPRSQPVAAPPAAVSYVPASPPPPQLPPGISTRSFYGAPAAPAAAKKSSRTSMPAAKSVAASAAAAFNKPRAGAHRGAATGANSSSSSASSSTSSSSSSYSSASAASGRRLSASGPMLGRPLNRGHRVPRPKQQLSAAFGGGSSHSHSHSAGAGRSEPAPAATPVEVRRFRSREEVIAAAHKLIESHSRITSAICAANREAAAAALGGHKRQATAAAAMGRPAPGGATKRRRATVGGAAAGSSGSPLSPLKSPTPDTSITQTQIDRLQRILNDSQQQSRAFELAARPLNWVGAAAAGAAVAQQTGLDTTADMDSTFGQISMLDTTNAMNGATVTAAAEEEAQPARKFFRSGARDATRHQYQHKFSGMVAPVKRSATAGLDQSGQPPSKRSNRAEYAELRIIQQDITDIISMLEDSIVVVPDATASAPTASAPSTAVAFHAASTTTITTPSATGGGALLSPDPLASAANYARFAPLLPYNTADPQLGERQLNLLQLLDTHHICSERTFRIFIAEPRLHEPEATAILDQLFQVDVAVADDPTAGADAGAAMDMDMEPLRVAEGESEADSVVAMAVADEMSPLSPASQISRMTRAMDLECAPPEQPATASSKMFPIFSRETRATGIAGAEPPSAQAEPSSAGLPAKPIDWRAYGRDARQLQIDAGQRRFGGAQCDGCGMFYARHEPEDEALHQQFHVLRMRLQFAGWTEERVVCEVPEWQQRGRVVCVTRDDSHQKRQRVAEIVALVDESLGVAERGCGEESVIYLAIARRQVVGVCVVEPRQLAHPMIEPSTVGSSAPPMMMDLTRQLPVRCGLSRLWVIEAYRRHGIGRRLFDAMRQHYGRSGGTLRLQDVAFGGPTEAGCQFAKRMLRGADVLVY